MHQEARIAGMAGGLSVFFPCPPPSAELFKELAVSGIGCKKKGPWDSELLLEKSHLGEQWTIA